MPRASRWLVRTSLVHLVLGFGLGAVILAAKGGYGGTAALRLVPAHADIVLFGWLIQIVMGVATWILPRDADRVASSGPAWIAWALLNAGIVASVASCAIRAPGLAEAGRLLEAAAVFAFVAGAAARVRPARRIPPGAGAPGPAR